MPVDPLRLDQQLCFALYTATRAMTRAYAPLLEPLGLTYPQYLVMLSLWEYDDRTVGALGDRLGLDSGTLTPLLKRLELRGLVERRRDVADERVVRVLLTADGRGLRTQAVTVPGAIACKAGVALDDARGLAALDHLRRELNALAVALEDPGTPPERRSQRGSKAVAARPRPLARSRSRPARPSRPRPPR